ncbi:hypothetical protein [Micromonospora sp. CV4]|uniref:hypothetical protein n=1 Tax=Micromonospora sp. CV4 TaxID=2478711 RepID=UPI001F438A19|nr:hypothetical protein [Micromonospora sp. CV4]
MRARTGVALADLVPELAGQGFIALLDQVYRTGEPYTGRDVRVVLGTGPHARESWGDAAWGCPAHVEEAILNVRSVFIASEELGGLGLPQPLTTAPVLPQPRHPGSRSPSRGSAIPSAREDGRSVATSY